MKYGFVNHDGRVLDRTAQALAGLVPEEIENSVDHVCYTRVDNKKWFDADIIFSHAAIDNANSGVSECRKMYNSVISHCQSRSGDIPLNRIFLVVSSAEYTNYSYSAKIIINDKKKVFCYFLRVINQNLINGNAPNKKAVNALLNLTIDDARYIIQCNQEKCRIDFSEENELASNEITTRKHSQHANKEDYHWLNLLFNKPANSDTLVGWYMLAKAYSLSRDSNNTEGKILLSSKKEWKINRSWEKYSVKEAEKAIEVDFIALKDSRNLHFKDEEKIVKPLTDFASLVYGNSRSLDERAVLEVLSALHQVFFPKDTQEDKPSAEKPAASLKKGAGTEKKQSSVEKKSSSGKKGG